MLQHSLILFFLYYGGVTAIDTARSSLPGSGLRFMPRPTPAPDSIIDARVLSKRQFPEASTCGYAEGNPNAPITAGVGFACRSDLDNALWGLCSEDVKAVSDCRFAGYCYDAHDCPKGCGMTAAGKTFASVTCLQTSQYCSIAILVFAADMTFTNIGCGSVATTETYYASTLDTFAKTTGTATATAITTSIKSSATSIPITSLSTTSSAVTPSTTSNACKSGTSPCGQTCMPIGSVCCEDNTFCSSGSTCVKGGCSNNTSTTSTTVLSTTVSPLPTPTANRSNSSNLNLGAIVAGTLGGLTLICITIIAVICIVRGRKGAKPRKRGLSVFRRKNSKNSSSSFGGSSTSGEAQYPDPPNDKAYPEAGWGPSEACGSEVRPHNGPWEMLNEERPVELSDQNRPAELPVEMSDQDRPAELPVDMMDQRRPAELPDYAYLETLPNVPQAPTRQDSWRPNDDRAAWGDVRPHPRIRDRLRYGGSAPLSTHNEASSIETVPREKGVATKRRGLLGNFASPGWDRMDEGITTITPEPHRRPLSGPRHTSLSDHRASSYTPKIGGGSQHSQRKVVGRSPSNLTNVSSHASIYTSSPVRP